MNKQFLRILTLAGLSFAINTITINASQNEKSKSGIDSTTSSTTAIVGHYRPYQGSVTKNTTDNEESESGIDSTSSSTTAVVGYGPYQVPVTTNTTTSIESRSRQASATAAEVPQVKKSSQATNQLFKAIKEKNIPNIIGAICDEADVNAKDENDRPPLWHAVKIADNLKELSLAGSIIFMLLNNGAKIPDYLKNNPIIQNAQEFLKEKEKSGGAGLFERSEEDKRKIEQQGLQRREKQLSNLLNAATAQALETKKEAKD